MCERGAPGEEFKAASGEGLNALLLDSVFLG